MKILFQGDSITDASRDRSDAHNLAGFSYYVSKLISDDKVEILNLGISGNTTEDLLGRYDEDFKKINPDILVLMVGINDIWHFYTDNTPKVTKELYEERLEELLKKVTCDIHSKIILLTPYILPAEDKTYMRKEVEDYIEVAKRLGAKYAYSVIDTDVLMNSYAKMNTYLDVSYDGVHPCDLGYKVLAVAIYNEIKGLIK